MVSVISQLRCVCPWNEVCLISRDCHTSILQMLTVTMAAAVMVSRDKTLLVLKVRSLLEKNAQHI